MRRNLNEQISRMRELAYGKKTINELNDNQTYGATFSPGRSIVQKDKVQKQDVPNKADNVNAKSQDLFNALQQGISAGGLKQQQQGSYQYQRTVEAMQIGLMMLGFQLPRYGVDGLFGAETANAVSQFNTKLRLDPKSGASPEMLQTLANKLKEKNISDKEVSKYTDPIITSTPTKGPIPTIDLNSKEGFSKYVQICDAFLSGKANALGITGTMLASGAKNAYNKYGNYVPPELALAQLQIEGGLSGDVKSKPIRTRNPFNVGNVDSGATVTHDNVQSAINTYYNLIAKNYLGDGRDANSLFGNFVNKKGYRYASATGYENAIKGIASNVRKISQQYA